MDDAIEGMEIDLEVSDIGEILSDHGVTPTVALVMAIWEWKESRRASDG